MFDHFWKCIKIQDIVQDIIKRFKTFLVNIIGEFSKEEIDKQQLEDKVEKLNMWDIEPETCIPVFIFQYSNHFTKIPMEFWNIGT
ncbi:hypothetical protein RhiirA4_483648 [Rhizophagus irregularis]|uniref:Uncharacterized protein n=1 Tax=Rhizophagus irregularis TaxID=588596 RepID=A0A2I1HMU0_9GLOM|nr:hypothetical protein RhiirA4_483648 [Rhizophagus irregularis]